MGTLIFQPSTLLVDVKVNGSMFVVSGENAFKFECHNDGYISTLNILSATSHPSPGVARAVKQRFYVDSPVPGTIFKGVLKVDVATPFDAGNPLDVNFREAAEKNFRVTLVLMSPVFDTGVLQISRL